MAHTCAYVYVCLYLYVCVCLSVCVMVCVYACVWEREYGKMSVLVCLHVSVWVCWCTFHAWWNLHFLRVRLIHLLQLTFTSWLTHLMGTASSWASMWTEPQDPSTQNCRVHLVHELTSSGQGSAFLWLFLVFQSDACWPPSTILMKQDIGQWILPEERKRRVFHSLSGVILSNWLPLHMRNLTDHSR